MLRNAWVSQSVAVSGQNQSVRPAREPALHRGHKARLSRHNAGRWRSLVSRTGGAPHAGIGPGVRQPNLLKSGKAGAWPDFVQGQDGRSFSRIAIAGLIGFLPVTPLCLGVPRFVAWFLGWRGA